MRVRVFALALLCCHLAYAASFDCRAAQRPVEHVICGNPDLSTADELLGRLYRNALARLSSGSVGVMRADQVQWLAWVQQVCPLPQHKSSSVHTAACMLPLYRTRLKLMRTAVVRRNGVTLLTRSQYFAQPDDRPEFKTYGAFHGTGTLEASWPAADSAEQEWQAWNRATERRTLLMALQGVDAPQQSPGEPVWSSNMALERNATVVGVLRSIEHDRVTVALSSESMGIPGAHPGEDYETDTWLLQAQRPLQEADVFSAGAKWKELVAAVCYTALKTGNSKDYLYQEVTGPEAKSLQKVIADPHNWTLERDGLHVTYPEYAVAPRMAQPDDTVIPWVRLKPVLAADFVAP